MIAVQDTSIAILVGGFGTRIKDHVPDLPKALIPINEKPFIQHLIDYFIYQGIRKFVFFVNYRAEQIQTYIQNHNHNLEIDIQFVLDGDTPKGTGGAIKLGLSLLSNPFFVQYGDTMLPIAYQQLIDMYNTNPKSIMTVLHNNNKGDVSNVLYKDKNLLVYDKKDPTNQMEHIDYGLMLLQKSLFTPYHDEKFDLSHVLHQGVWDKNIQGLEVDQLFYEIGSIEGIKRTEKFFRQFLSSVR